MITFFIVMLCSCVIGAVLGKWVANRAGEIPENDQPKQKAVITAGDVWISDGKLTAFMKIVEYDKPNGLITYQTSFETPTGRYMRTPSTMTEIVFRAGNVRKLEGDRDSKSFYFL